MLGAVGVTEAMMTEAMAPLANAQELVALNRVHTCDTDEHLSATRRAARMFELLRGSYS